MGWRQVQELVKILSLKVREDFGDLDCIVGVARGGWIPARLLASELTVKRLYNFGIAYSDESRTDVDLYQNTVIERQRVLIIEDAVESGRSLEYGKSQLVDRDNVVASAALLRQVSSRYKPDYVSEVQAIPSFPWE